MILLLIFLFLPDDESLTGADGIAQPAGGASLCVYTIDRVSCAGGGANIGITWIKRFVAGEAADGYAAGRAEGGAYATGRAEGAYAAGGAEGSCAAGVEIGMRINVVGCP